MPARLREHIKARSFGPGTPPPVVSLSLFFEGNTEETSIAPNQWGEGRPSIAELHMRFQQISLRPNVQHVWVGLHPDWNSESYAEQFLPAEHILIMTSASQSEVEGWLTGLCCSGVVRGWPYGKPIELPQAGKGYHVFSVCWD